RRHGRDRRDALGRRVPVSSRVAVCALVHVLRRMAAADRRGGCPCGARVRDWQMLWRDPVRVAGIAGGVLLGLQLSANQWTYTYLPWAFPFVAVALLLERGGARSSEGALSASENGAARAPAPREQE